MKINLHTIVSGELTSALIVWRTYHLVRSETSSWKTFMLQRVSLELLFSKYAFPLNNNMYIGDMRLKARMIYMGTQGAESPCYNYCSCWGLSPPNFCINLAFQNALTLLPMCCIVLLKWISSLLYGY